MKDTANPVFLGSITSYPDQGFNHSSWLNESGKYILFTDENKGLDMKIFNLENLSDPKFISQFNSHPDATPHNAFWVGDLAYVSSYHDGLRIYNLKNPEKPEEVAWYDTHPVIPEQYGGYRGCWGVYPFLPSKKIIASDLTAGIFVFEVDSNLVGNDEGVIEPNYFSLFPNPTQSQINIHFSGYSHGQIEVFNYLGTSIMKQFFNENKFTVDVSHLPSGSYFLRINNQHKIFYKKFIKQ